MTYSDPQQIAAFTGNLHPSGTEETRPVFVLDMDGNVAVAMVLKDGVVLELGENDDPLTQSIPAGVDAHQLVADGLADYSLFTDKPRDVRLAPDLVEKINELHASGDFHSIILNTSRSYEDAQFILQESGVKNIELMGLISNSGNRVQLGGEVSYIYELSEAEQEFVQNSWMIIEQMKERVRDILKENGFGRLPHAPLLYFEDKGDACNIHFRNLLKIDGIDEDSDIVRDISARVFETMNNHAKDRFAAPKTENGAPLFKVGHGPMTCEMKLANVTKADGMAAVMEGLRTIGRNPDKVGFAGDDCNQEGDSYGTDWYAMNWVNKKLGEQGLVIHTHHPAGEGMPDPDKAAAQNIHIDIVTKTPLETAGLVVKGVVAPGRVPSPAFEVTR